MVRLKSLAGQEGADLWIRRTIAAVNGFLGDSFSYDWRILFTLVREAISPLEVVKLQMMCFWFSTVLIMCLAAASVEIVRGVLSACSCIEQAARHRLAE